MRWRMRWWTWVGEFKRCREEVEEVEVEEVEEEVVH